MRLIKDILAAKQAAGQPVISFELFPPRTAEGDKVLLEKTLPALRQLGPDYCSVTYGAGGSTQDKSLMIVDQVQRVHGLPALAHLTCVNATHKDIRSLLQEAQALNAQKTEIGWGHQIRSYVLQPYQLVKDLRTNVEKTNPQAVLDGDLDDFMAASLAQRIGGLGEVTDGS